ncbi:unnamed protein product [Victoria cruziana]
MVCRETTLLLVPIILHLLSLCSADVGTAAFYDRPYVPTACYGSDVSQIPSDNLFAAASGQIWDNGAACGRIYEVRCLSGDAPPNPCMDGVTVRVTVVDRAPPVSTPSTSGTTLVLNVDAFTTIADSVAPLINIEFLQV